MVNQIVDKKCVLIIGSGFSCAVGEKAKIAIPATAGLIKAGKSLIQKNRNPFPDLLPFIKHAQKYKPDIDIEELYDSVDIAAKMNEHHWIDGLPREPEPILKQFRHLIALLLSKIMRDRPGRQLTIPCAAMLKPFRVRAILSLNWDVIVDRVLDDANLAGDVFETRGIEPNMYGLEQPIYRWDEERKLLCAEIKLGHRAGSVLLKLHGSLNWFSCRDVKHFIPISPRAVAYAIGNPDLRCPHDGSKMDPLILPPSSGKDYSVYPFPTIWRRALEELKNADRVVFYGCAIRPTDFYLRDLLLKARMSGKEQPQVFVVDKKSREIIKRLKELIGYKDVQVWRTPTIS